MLRHVYDNCQCVVNMKLVVNNTLFRIETGVETDQMCALVIISPTVVTSVYYGYYGKARRAEHAELSRSRRQSPRELRLNTDLTPTVRGGHHATLRKMRKRRRVTSSAQNARARPFAAHSGHSSLCVDPVRESRRLHPRRARQSTKVY